MSVKSRDIFLVIMMIAEIVLSQQLFSFLDNERIEAFSFIKQNPTYDGRDVVIIILDSGVDMGVDGLKFLPDGDVKVIDAVDFSGEGDVYFEEARIDTSDSEVYVQNMNGIRLYGIDKINLTPVDSVYFMGVLKEAHFKNSDLADINRNRKLDDQFAFTVFNIGEDWVVYFDLDGDSNIDDEQVIYNYKKSLKHFNFRSTVENQESKLNAFALNIFPDEYRVNLHYDGSGHGTHVAGIAAGYQINNQEGLNGIAPGAKIISLKIGDCRLAGGATTSGSMLAAYEYGMEFARNYKGPVVFNMSYGIGSEQEGLADMDLALDDILLENPEALICISAGNEGPGISTVGLPAASKYALTVGALNTVKSARDVYGANLKSDKLFVFSSRGGEINKPDIIAPGAASSTIPPFSTRENKWGTSMAAPQASGAVALLMSAINQQSPDLPISGALIKKAIKNSAQPLAGYLPVDQGRGVINVTKAFRFYKNYVSKNEEDLIYSYSINTLSPIYDNEQGTAAYWRFGGYLPDANHKQKFYIEPVFNPNIDENTRHTFYRSFQLSSTASWLKLNKSSTYIKGDKAAIVEVFFDKSRLKRPGIYNAAILGFHKGGWFSGSRPENLEFELMATAVIPHVFNEDNDYTINLDKISLKAGDVHRIFFEVPINASSAVVKINSTNPNYSNIRGYLFDTKGREFSEYLYLNSEKRNLDVVRLNSTDLESGIWELVLYADFRNEEVSQIELKIGFSNLQVNPEIISKVQINNGDLPNGYFDVINKSRSLFEGSITGEIYGLQKIRQIAEMGDFIEIPFTVDDKCDRVEFELELPVSVFNKLTDFAINVKDYGNSTLKAEGMIYKSLKFEFIPPSSGDYFLELIPAFAGDDSPYWTARLIESYYNFKKTYISGTSFEAYPDLKKRISFEINGDLKVAPDGFHVFGDLQINSRKHDYQRISVPVKIDTSLPN